MSFRLIRALAAPIALAACLLPVTPSLSFSQGTDTTALTSLSKIYTLEQAAKGKDIHDAVCLSCHKPAEQAGPKFWELLVGRSVGDFFSYLRANMPQDTPGQLSNEDYANVVAYIFSLNAMPAGDKPLAGDSASLSKIRVVHPDSTRKPGK